MCRWPNEAPKARQHGQQQPHRDEAGQGVGSRQQILAAGQQPSCNPIRHGSGPRTWQRQPETKQGQTSPQGNVRSQGQRKVGQ